MKNLFTPINQILIGVIFIIVFSSGHHHETALSKKHFRFDLNDIYVFESSNPGNTSFILSFNEKASLKARRNFGKNGIYQMHIGFEDDLSEGLTYSFEFTKKKVTMFQIQNADPALGEVGQVRGKGNIGEIIENDHGIKLWTGIAQDPFNGNSLGLRNMRKAASQGFWDTHAFDEAQDLFSAGNVAAIVLDIPNDLLPKKVFYFASSAKKIKGTEKGHRHKHWHTINRIGHVLLPHLYLSGENQKSMQMQGSISTDVDRKDLVIATVSKYAKLVDVQKDPNTYAQKVADQIMPDYMGYTIGSEAAYELPKLNGRKLTDDSMNTALELLCGTIVDDFVPINNHYTDVFPYLLEPKNN